MLKLPLFPLHTVLFPGMVLPLHIFEPRYRRMVSACLHDQAPFGVVLIRSGPEVGGLAAPFSVGTRARIRRVEHLADGRMNIEAVGEERFRLLQLYSAQDEVHTGEIAAFPLLGSDEPAAHVAARALRRWLTRYLELLGRAAHTQLPEKPFPADPAGLAYFAAIIAQLPALDKQTLLEVGDTADLLVRERALYRRETSLMRAMLSRSPGRAGQTHSPN
jgi:Lon protease-like protein